MPMWRCPHCGTPQAETARCWVCRRSSTSCGTCRNYRRSVAGQLGYCGLDRRRQPLTGDEIRGCWEAWPAALLPDGAVPLTIAPARSPGEGKQPLAFVEVAAEEASADDATGDAVTPLAVPGGAAPGAAGWSLWGDLEG
jgi:hypothetical protein